MAISVKEMDEIKRKKALGIPLTNPTAEKKRAYDHYVPPAPAAVPSKTVSVLLPGATLFDALAVALGGGSRSATVVNPSIPAPASGSYVAPIFAAALEAPTVTDPRETRRHQLDSYTGWDNNPDVRALQARDFQIYIDTGQWNTPEQQHLHALAEQIRTSLNPTYGGLPKGPLDWIGADKIFPRDTTPNANNVETGIDNTVLNTAKWGSYAKVGIGAFFLIFIMSMFRR